MDLSKNHILKAKFNKNFKTTKVRNFKFGDMISNKVVHVHFWSGYVTCFGADALKTFDNEIQYVILIIDFRHVFIYASVAYWLKAPVYETIVIE